MRILFDQGTPVPIRSFLQGHTVKTAAEQGWSTLENGELLRVAEAAGFELLLTTDKNLIHQQNLQGRSIAIVAIGNAQWPELRPHVQIVVAAVNAATPGSYHYEMVFLSEYPRLSADSSPSILNLETTLNVAFGRNCR